MRDLIIRLARPMMRMLGRGERGAIGVLIAILVGGGVLVGMGALAIDVGQLYQERAELQNAADAAALGAAKGCADGTCTLAAATTTASALASANASKLTNNLAAVGPICGSGSLGACGSPSGAITDCPAAPSGGAGYVDVHTSTKTAGGTLLPPVFAQTLLGNASFKGTTVLACAQAEWGPAQQAASLAITISVCQWNSLTAGGGNPFGVEIPLIFKSSAKPCSGPAGQNVAGGFGWLPPNASSGCQANIDLTTSTTYSDPGNNVPTGCAAVIKADVASGATVYIPVFDSVTGTGNNATYHVIGLAALVLNGYQNLPGVHPDVVPSGMQGKCNPSNVVCLFGYFTQALVPLSDGIGGGTDFGATAIKLTG
jgi:Flp pilus assembly protein TadG